MTDLLNDLDNATPEQIAEIAAILGMTDAPTVEEPKAAPSAKIKCKCCGFYKKPRKVLRETGICGVCTAAISDGDEGYAENPEVAVVGRMGKRGRNTVSVVIDGKRWKVKRLSPKHSEKVAARYASKPKGFAKKAKRTGSEPKGIRKDSRIGADREQRTPDA